MVIELFKENNGSASIVLVVKCIWGNYQKVL